MSETFVTVPLRYDESAFPLGTVTYSQYALATTSFASEHRIVKLTDDEQFEKVPMVLSDQRPDY